MAKKVEIFSSRLKCLRVASGLTQNELANKLNISRSCLANYERGKRFPDEEILLLISNYFKVSIDYLNGIDGIMSDDVDISSIETIKSLSTDGQLDLSTISSSSKIALVEFFKFLEQRDSKST